MIARLIIADLLSNLRIWAGVLAVGFLTAFIAGLAAGFLESGIRAGGVTALATYGISGVVIVFVLVAAIIVLSSVAGLTVALQEREYALWQVIGFTPARIQAVVLMQVLVASTVASILGAVAAGPALAPMLGYVLEGARGFDGLGAVSSPVGVFSAVGTVVLVSVVASMRAARAASRVTITVAIRGGGSSPRPFPRARMVGVGLLTVAGAGMIFAQEGRSPGAAELPLLIAGVLLAAAVAGVGAPLYAWVTRGWTRAVPTRLSVAWFLARAAAADNIRRGAATVGPLMIASASSGLLFSLDATVSSARADSAPGAGLPSQVVVLLIGGPILLSIAGATATVFMSGRSRAGEQALLQSAGATPEVVIASAVYEAVIYVGTGLLSALVVTVLAVAGSALALHVAPVLRLGEAAVVASGALVLMLAATVAPTIRDLGRGVRAPLLAA
ncbi:FtsX-like permease family protein [Microbacterium sp. 3J1]|uniref:FtsX-like permease family protein n=1 Tax=Microbacterium sp. 3J1 TaxID=861269 RepID=UPI000A921099|nr:FtsX-like permease family protein [Microbacterium sp. 3J1]